jgi:peptidoglycan/xylan/chitin deacetylase (PgdA/CDA1 family)
MVRTLLAAGHEVGNHTWSHVRMVGHGAAFYDAELARTNAALRAAGGTPTLFRPPYGKKLIGLPRAVERAGMTMVTWDVEDPATQDPHTFARQVVAQARPGSIILVHAMYRSNTTARAALPIILDGLAAKGLRVVSVSELRAAASPSPRPS